MIWWTQVNQALACWRFQSTRRNADLQLTWMEPVLASGQISGKLVCPNDKCGAKIGNYDWAGVQCGCKEWVTPGFCISRSKVDEVW